MVRAAGGSRRNVCADSFGTQAVLAVPSPSARDSGCRALCESCFSIPSISGAHPPWRLQKEYAQEIADKLSALGLFADVDNGADTLPKKIRNGELAQYNFLLGASRLRISSVPHGNTFLVSVVGQEELDGRSVNVRNRDDVGTKSKGEMVPLDEVTAKLVALKSSRRIENKLV
jgi:threonyl-tRNA synthetase